VTEPAPRWGRYGRRPLAVLCTVGLVDAFDRGVIPAVLESMQDDLGFSNFQAGLLNTALIVAAVLLAVPGGLLADRLDRRKLMGGVLFLWSISTVIAGLSQRYWQVFTMRAALGAGDAINDPSAQSLVADYYPVAVRGRAYAFQRVVPTVGLGLGTVFGGILLGLFNWRVAVVAIAAPGVLVALLVRRLPLPPRGEADGAIVVREEVPTTWACIKEVVRVPSVRVLLVSTAFINGILTALGFWGVAYHVRASGLSESKAAAVGGGVILLGAIAGGVGGGLVTDKLRGRVRGAPMLLAAVVTALGTVALFISFLDGIPVYAVRLPLQMIGVGLVVSSLPPLTVITAEVVPADLRGSSFGMVKLFANCLGAITPALIGLIADHRMIMVNGKLKGDLGYGFRTTMWVILIGSALLLLGRRYVDNDTAAALRADAALTPHADA
jgi:MFS family permease